jgi:hypothetical protein
MLFRLSLRDTKAVLIKKLFESNRPVLLADFCFTTSTEFLRVAYAETGVSETKIVFGQSAAFEGPASALGQGMDRIILTEILADGKYNAIEELPND